MFLLILHWLQELGIRIPVAFDAVTTRVLLSSLSSLLITLFMGPFFIRKLYAMKVGQPIRKEHVPVLYELHKNKKDTPTMGGILILFAVVISLFLWMDLRSPFTWILLFSLLIFGYVGGKDDYLKIKHKNTKGLSAKRKMVVQLIVGSFVALFLIFPAVQEWFSMGGFLKSISIQLKTGDAIYSASDYGKLYFMPFLKSPVFIASGLSLILVFIVTNLVIVGSSNAVNLTDGLDGLAAGCVVLVAAVLALFAFLSSQADLARHLNIIHISGSGEVAVFLASIAGGCLGFLWFNGHPAQVFMGDVGSLSLGGLLGVSSILIRRELILFIAGGIFVAETVSVILQVLSYKYRNQKRVFLCAPLHHHFEHKNWPETKVVLRFWLISFILAALSLVSIKFQ